MQFFGILLVTAFFLQNNHTFSERFRMSELSTRLHLRRKELGLSQEELAQRMGYRSKSSITKLEKGINDLPQSKVEELAAALETTPAYLLGLDTPCPPPGFEPLPAMTQVPLIGSIACGTPITAEQNIERYIGVPAAWRADFALTCHGDSMSPTICDGDIVCIRCQPEVEQGEIAAVRIGGEATLKHFHRQGDAVMLLADNAAVCPPMIFTGLQLEELHIEGRAVGLCRGL
jgi:repressor LexA